MATGGDGRGRGCGRDGGRPRPRALAWAVAALLAGIGPGLSAQTDQDQDKDPGEGNRAFRWMPGIALTETLTDNARLSAGTAREADAITELSASLALERRGGRVQGFLDYSLTGVWHAKGSAPDDLRHDLKADGRAELIDEFAYVDAGAAIDRQSISPFGSQSIDDTLVNPNRTEVRRYSLSPYLRGQLGRRTSWEARLSYAATDSSDESASDVTDMAAFLEAGGDVGERLGWAVRASRDVNDYRLGRRTETDSATATLRWAPNPHLQLSGTGGRESTDALSLEKRSSRRYGFGLDWRPSERTRLAFEREQRYFGRSHAFVFSHQMPRSAWTYSDIRGLGSSADGVPVTRGTIFDLFFRQFASIEPDPVLRTTLVNTFLQANGLDPDAQALGGFLTTAQTLERHQSLSLSFSGMRNVMVVSVQQGRTQLLDASAAVPGDLAESGVIRQRGAAVTLARRLTPSATLNLGFAQQHSRGELDSRSNRLRSYNLTWSNRLGSRVTLSVGARHTRFEDASSPYRENAITARLSARF